MDFPLSRKRLSAGAIVRVNKQRFEYLVWILKQFFELVNPLSRQKTGREFRPLYTFLLVSRAKKTENVVTETRFLCRKVRDAVRAATKKPDF